MLRLVETRCLFVLCGACLLASSLAAQTGPLAPRAGAPAPDAALATAATASAAPPAASARGLRSNWPGFLIPDASSEGALLVGPVFAKPRGERPRKGRASVLVAWTYAPRQLRASETSSFSKYGENTGKFGVDYAQGKGAGLSVDIGVPLHGGFGLELGGEYLHRSGTARAAAQVPHPFYFSRARTITHNIDSGLLNETALRIGALYTMPVGPLRASVFAGTSLSSVEMDLVDRLVFTQVYPYDAENVSVVSMPVQRVRKLLAGPDAGLALDIPLFGHVGIGAIARYSGVSAALMRPEPDVPAKDDQTVLGQQTIRPATGTSVKVDTRGVRLAIGTRVTF